MPQINTVNTSLAVGTDQVMVSEQKKNGISERVDLVVMNTSTGGQVITIAAGCDAVAGSGIVIGPGGHKTWSKTSSYPVQQERVMAISNLAGGQLAIYEEVLQ